MLLSRLELNLCQLCLVNDTDYIATHIQIMGPGRMVGLHSSLV